MTTYTTRIVCIVFWFYCAAINPSRCSSDVLALLALKAGIHVDSLGALSSWNKSQDYCSWSGITCGFKHPGRVVGINLMSQHLVGFLSSHVGNLSFLRKINLRNNSFHGQIPREIGRLRRLEYVEFSNNSFVGEIPRNISQCPNLSYLNLIDNSLSGTIPEELGFLINLRRLGLGRNNLSGVIPSFLGNLTTLIELSLSECNMKGEIPKSLGKLQSLERFIFTGNTLTGRIPFGLFNISTLRVFAVSRNQLQGVIPDNIGLTLPNVEGLYMRDNRFTGEIPVSLSNASSLEDIILDYNSFKGSIPRELGRLSNLEALVTTHNLIQDDISFVESLTNCTSLRVLAVGDNMLKGSLPYSISNFSNQIFILEIFRNQIHGSIPSGIGNLVSLARLLFFDNNLDGHVPFSIGKLSNLQGLFLGGNRLTDEIPRSIGNLSLLNELSLQQNSLSGSIPQSISNCTRLLSFNLADNNLGGTIPSELMSLSSISIFLNLSNNGFSGSIPFEVGSFIHLSIFDLSNNRLSGVIPNSISSCASLERLHLEGNLLEGDIPLTLSALKGLRDLDLSRNNLSGKIPSFLSQLNLENLNISFNRLNGEVPKQGVFGNKTAVSVEGNPELCGGILELKLPPCSSSKSSKHLFISLKILVPTLVAGVLCITLCVCIFIYIYQQKKSMKILSSMGSFNAAQFMRLSYGDLLKATSRFSEVNLIGAGRFGSVYKGILEDGKTTVAVKVLNLVVKGASKSFIAECIALKGVRHRNLLKLMSICESIDFQRNEFKALVYEFMSNGSLEDLLHRNREQGEEHDMNFRSLNMLQRLKIAIDVAHALEYLHTGTDSPIVHGDLKPSNVLLDDDMTAHVGDFGLSKVVSIMLEGPESSSTFEIRGTIGYDPPEYGTSSLVSTKGDVYSYGILLLEMFTGKRPTDSAFDENLNLHDFVTGALPNHAIAIVDPLILEGSDMNRKMMECLVSTLSIGVTCSRQIPTDRICMADAIRELCKIKDYYMSEI